MQPHHLFLVDKYLFHCYSSDKQMTTPKKTSRILIGIFFLIILYVTLSTILNKNPEFDTNKLLQVNYSGLPDGVDVNVYPESHNIKGSQFNIVFENNRDEELYWGSEWKAEKWINGEWTYQDPNWVWTMELRIASPYSTVINSEKFPFSNGIYRITKKCMLTNIYLRDQNKWESEFIVTFYLIKQS